MADTKISALTVATTPLAGTEVLPIVQSGVTKQVSVANLTAGRAISADSLTLTGSPLPATSGGTGQSSYAVGDLLYASTTTALSKLADVATGNALISGGVGVAPSWGKIGLTTHVSGTLPVANGGTNLTSFTSGGILYASSTSALTTGSALTFSGKNLAIGATLATWYANSVVAQIGTGGVIEARDNYAPSMAIAANAYIDTAGNDVYLTTNYATRFEQSGGVMRWKIAASGTAGANISFTTALTLDQSFNLSFYSGNIVQGTAAKGINFTANTGAAGKTSQLLNWYEEGTWTPAVNGGSGTTYTTQNGWYTRVGNLVTVGFELTINAAGTITGGAAISGLPFTSAATYKSSGSLSYAGTVVTSTVWQGLVIGASQSVLTIYIKTAAGTSTTSINGSDFFGAGTQIIGLMTYRV